MSNSIAKPQVLPAVSNWEVNVAPTSVWDIARAYVRAGLSIIPIKVDGSKSPACSSWAPYQDRMPDARTLHLWFASGRPRGIAIICGRVSGGLEVIDIDVKKLAGSWTDLVRRRGGKELLDRLPVVVTPAGCHFYYRCSHVRSNQKLA